MDNRIRKLQQQSQLLTSYVSDQNLNSIQRTPEFIHSLVVNSKFGDDKPSTTIKDNAHMFWMEKGVDTTSLMKSLEEGKSKLSSSSISSVSEYDVEGHIRQFHENAIASTLSESQSLLDSTCSDRIWKMMDKEFIDTKNAILNSETKQTTLQSNSTISYNIPITERRLATPPVITQTPNTDISLISIYEPAIKKLFQSLRQQTNLDVATLFLSSLIDSKQDLAGEVFCWKLLIQKLKLTQVGRDYYRDNNRDNSLSEVSQSIHFLSQEYIDYMKRVLVRKCKVSNLPSNDILEIICSYINVMNESKDINQYELDHIHHLPLWQILYYLIRCNCSSQYFTAFYDDIRRNGGSVGNDLVKILSLCNDCCQGKPIDSINDLQGMVSRIRGSLYRLIGSGCQDYFKLLVFAILCNESPYSSIVTTDKSTNTVHIVEQEVLLTLQDWLWYKLLSILLFNQIFHSLPILSKGNNRDEFTFQYLQSYISQCESSLFDMNGTKPFSYIQNLIIINHYDKAIQYLIEHNYVVSAVMLSLLLYYYGVLAEDSNHDNYYYVCLSCILPHLRNRIDLATYLIAVIRDSSIKMNFCIKLLLLSNQYDILVGKLMGQNQRSKGLYDELIGVNVNEVIKETACVLNDQNDWMKAYELFCLCNNYDNAANILIKNLAVAYQNNSSNKLMLLQKTQEFKTILETLPNNDLLPSTVSSLDILLQVIDIIELVDQNRMNDAFQNLLQCLVLPASNELKDIQVAITNMQNVNTAIIQLFPEVLLKCCQCIHYHYTMYKNQYYVITNEMEKKQVINNMNSLRSIIEGYEQLVGNLGIPIPPAINEKLSQIVVSMA